jgi:hypothetical protein
VSLADIVAVADDGLAAVLEHIGTSADYRVGGGTATPVSVVVSIAELADDYIQRRYGHERTRVADVLIRRAVLASPAHGDTVTVAAGPHAGVWTVLGVERRDDVAIVARVRRSERTDAAAPGAREVRR